MVQGQKEARRVAGGIIMGAGVAAGVMVLLCFAGALLLLKEVIPERAAQLLSWGICALGTMTGCAAAMKKAGAGRLPVSLACAGLTLLAMGLGRAVLNSGTEGAWVSAAVCMAASLATALLGAGRKRKRR